ncbi:MAG: hypothetical protein JSR42_21075 [Proteobacteria bacterium]|nr:hypothetical protein [Pseudomonadota bacterium]
MLSIAPQLFKKFLDTVVIDGVFSDSERALTAGPLGAKSAQEVASGRRIDHRTPYLMTVSGKGGYLPGPDFSKRESFRNITLLDHLVSVARGGAVLAELDLRAVGVNDTGIRSRIALLIAVGFLHDTDKILGLSRTDELKPEHVENLLQRFHVDRFLEVTGVRVSPADLLSMIHAVEVSRSGTLKPGMRLLTAEEHADCGYVRLADRLEGLFLNSAQGPVAMVAELQKYGGFRSPYFATGWRVLHLRSAHTPFLLNALQRGLCAQTIATCGMPPLLEIHHDGELIAIVPEPMANRIIEEGIRRATRPLNLSLRVIVPQGNGMRDMQDGGSGPEDLHDALRDDPVCAAKSLFVHIDFLTGEQSLRNAIDSLFGPLGFPPNYAGIDKFGGKLFQLWPVRAGDDELIHALRTEAAMIAVALGCAEPKEKSLAAQVPPAEVREAELVAALAQTNHVLPDWMAGIHHRLSRQSLLAAWAAALAERDEVLSECLFGSDGLLKLWLCGDGARRAGLFDKIGDPGAVLIEAAAQWLRGALNRRFVGAENDDSEGRCHFTNLPVSKDTRIDAKSGLEGIKTSAFSGREGRPESFESSKSQTLVSAPAAAEHRLRTLMGEGRGNGDIPAYVSTPTMMGLFASLNMRADPDFLQLNHYDLMRQEIRADKPVFPESETYGHRLMFARHASIPGKTAEVISFTRMMLQSALRMGRPVHVFRGLPTSENAFVHFDFLPSVIERGIGGRSLRLEQIPSAIGLLRNLEAMSETPNLGLELALRYADPSTRFAAACEALAVLNRLPDDKLNKLADLRRVLQTFTRSPDTIMTPSDNVLIEFARAMTRVQEAPSRDASNAVRTLGLKIALDAVEACAVALHQTGKETQIAAIAGALENEFERSSRLAWRGSQRDLPFPRKAAMAAASLFVEQVWPIAFKGRPPASKARRIAMAVYQVAFETESYRPRDKPNPQATVADNAAEIHVSSEPNA